MPRAQQVAPVLAPQGGKILGPHNTCAEPRGGNTGPRSGSDSVGIGGDGRVGSGWGGTKGGVVGFGSSTDSDPEAVESRNGGWMGWGVASYEMVPPRRWRWLQGSTPPGRSRAPYGPPPRNQHRAG
jgi:hypothetical protein